MSKVISCIVPNVIKAEEAVSRLQSSGFTTSEISVLYAHREGNHLTMDKSTKGMNEDRSRVTLEKHTKAPEGAATGGATLGVVGGVLGLLAGIGSLAIPGAGPFIAAGPIMAALSGLAAGAVTGGILGGLVGLGIPEIEAKEYEKKLKAGHALVSVHTDDADRRKRARDVFKECSGDDITETRDLAA